MPISEDHTAIHSIYCLLTNRTLPLEMPHHFMWNAWKAKGYTEAVATKGPAGSLAVSFLSY